METPIYFDYHATTPVDPRVLEAMKPYYKAAYGNPASQHSYGWEASKAVETARNQVGNLLGSDPREIIFTSGATESNNLAIIGLFRSYGHEKNHIITTATEHRSVLEPIKYLESQGAKIQILQVAEDGRLDLDLLAKSITEKTLLVSVMAGNNEIGTIQDVEAIASITNSHDVFFHCDAAQAVGRIPLDVSKIPIDLLALSGHKINGPKGVGALFIRKKQPRTKLTPLFFGSEQEMGLRPGTLPVPLIVGLGRACEILKDSVPEEIEKIKSLRNHLWEGLKKNHPWIRLNGSLEHRLPGNLNICFPRIANQSLLAMAKGIAMSTGSACVAGTTFASHVLKAIGLSDEDATSSIRLGLGRFTSTEEVDHAIMILTEAISKLKKS